MRIDAIDVAVHEGRPARAVGNARREWPVRRGVIVVLTDEKGAVGIGEASPLDGYTLDTFESCERALRKLTVGDFPEFDPGGNWTEQIDRCASRIDPNNPGALFAVETALLDLASRRLGTRPACLLNRSVREDPVPLSALVRSATPGDAISETRRAWDRGIRTVKVKAGREGAFDDELELLHALRDAFGDELRIRVDLNGAWKLPEVAEKSARLAEIRPEFIEQPTVPYLLLKLSNAGDLPVTVAADETLQFPGAAERLSLVKACRVFVLKPAALGGVTRALRVARIARAQRASVVVSHMFDGPVALAAAIELVCALPEPPLACGLDRHDGLSIWPETDIAGLGESEIRFVPGAGLGVSDRSVFLP